MLFVAMLIYLLREVTCVKC